MFCRHQFFGATEYQATNQQPVIFHFLECPGRRKVR